MIFDFDGVFTDNMVYVSDSGAETIRCWRSDGLGIHRLKAVNVNTYIVSTEVNSVVAVRAKKLGIPYKQAVSDKSVAVRAICEELKVDLKNTVFVGNDVNDIPALMIVGIPVAVYDAYTEVLPYIEYRTTALGGYGAVREVCDVIYKAKTAAK